MVAMAGAAALVVVVVVVEVMVVIVKSGMQRREFRIKGGNGGGVDDREIGEPAAGVPSA